MSIWVPLFSVVLWYVSWLVWLLWDRLGCRHCAVVCEGVVPMQIQRISCDSMLRTYWIGDDFESSASRFRILEPLLAVILWQ